MCVPGGSTVTYSGIGRYKTFRSLKCICQPVASLGRTTSGHASPESDFWIFSRERSCFLSNHAIYAPLKARARGSCPPRDATDARSVESAPFLQSSYRVRVRPSGPNSCSDDGRHRFFCIAPSRPDFSGSSSSSSYSYPFIDQR